MPYDIDSIRNNIRKAVSGKFTDPDEFRPKKVEDAGEIKYRFFILPPFKSGDMLKSGPATRSMDNFFLTNGSHWINDRPHACPRVWDGSDCDICQYGFDLLKECKEKKFGDDRKKAILQQWMPNTYYMVNIYFTMSKTNPEDLRGKTKFYNAPKTCLDKWMATLMKDDKGDEENPDAYGVFFDENAAFCFELVAARDGRNNGYKTSAFVKNNGIPVPMIMNEDRTPNKKKLEQLLMSRIDLFTKVEVPDREKISRLANTMINGDDEPIGGGGFDSDESRGSSHEVPARQAERPQERAQERPTQSTSTKPIQARSEAQRTVERTSLHEDTIAPGLANEAPLVKERTTSKANHQSDDDDIGEDDIDALLHQLDD